MVVPRYTPQDQKRDERPAKSERDIRIPDPQLWQEFQRGGESAYSTIYKDNVRLLYSYGLKLTPNKALVMDLIQDLFIELWDSRERLGEVRSIKFYLLSCIRRKILHQSSKLKFKSIDPEDETRLAESIPSAEHALIEKQMHDEEQKRLDFALSTLSSSQQEIIHLRYHGRLGYDEIARIVSSDKKSVYNLMARTIRTLRESLEITLVATLAAVLF